MPKLRDLEAGALFTLPDESITYEARGSGWYSRPRGTTGGPWHNPDLEVEIGGGVVLLDHAGMRCGLNADWCVQAWHMGPCAFPNQQSGDYYILDLEDDDRPDSFELVQRFPNDDNDEINTIAQGDAETMIATARAILKERKARQ